MSLLSLRTNRDWSSIRRMFSNFIKECLCIYIYVEVFENFTQYIQRDHYAPNVGGRWRHCDGRKEWRLKSLHTDVCLCLLKALLWLPSPSAQEEKPSFLVESDPPAHTNPFGKEVYVKDAMSPSAALTILRFHSRA